MSDREYVCGRFAREYGLGVSRRAAPIDPAAEKAVLEWLGRKLEAASAECSDHDFFNIKAIQRLLAEPRLPAEPTRETRDVLATAFRRALHGNSLCIGLDIYRALYAHLTKPATKEVEVWRVEYATAQSGPHCLTFTTEGDARRQAESMRGGIAHCIHVTGPHKQEVPS